MTPSSGLIVKNSSWRQLPLLPHTDLKQTITANNWRSSWHKGEIMMISVDDEMFVSPLQIKVCELTQVWDQQHGSEWGERGGREGGAHQSSEVRWGSPTVYDSFPCQSSELKALHHQYSQSKLGVCCVKSALYKKLYQTYCTNTCLYSHIWELPSTSWPCVLRRAIEIKLDFINLHTFIFSKLRVWGKFDFIYVLQDRWGTRFS